MSGARDVPVPTPETAPFWEGCREGRLLIQHCAACGHRQFYPRLLCTACGATAPAWIEASGRAVVESFTIVRQAIAPSRAPDVPYVLALVRLDEGPTLMTNIAAVHAATIAASQKPAWVSHQPMTGPVPMLAGAVPSIVNSMVTRSADNGLSINGTAHRSG